MKTKFFALLLALSLALSLSACGGKDGPAQDGAPGSPEDGAAQKEVNLTDFYNKIGRAHV